MKRIALLIAAVVALAFSSIALAGNGGGSGGHGGGINAHLTRLDAHVASYVTKCKVASPAANCAALDSKLAAKLSALDAKIQAKLNQHPNSSKLQDALTQINALQAQL